MSALDIVNVYIDGVIVNPYMYDLTTWSKSFFWLIPSFLISTVCGMIMIACK
jgi:hypothetical protein